MTNFNIKFSAKKKLSTKGDYEGKDEIKENS